MAEDNKDEWGSDQLPRTDDGAQASAQGSSGGAGEANGQTSVHDGGETPTEVIAGAAHDGDQTLTETLHTGYRPDDTAPQTATAPTTAGEYRPAPEYGAYGTVPTQASADANAQQGQNPQAPQSPSMPVNPASGSRPGSPWGGLFRGGAAQGPSAAQNSQPNAPVDNGGNPYSTQQQNNAASSRSNGGFYGPNGPLGLNVPQSPNGGLRAAKRSGVTSANVMTAVVAALVSALLCFGLGWAGISNGWITVPSDGSMSNISSNKSGSGSATVKGGQAPDWQNVAKDVQGSVVSIQTTVNRGVAKGSGAVIDDKGHVVTNNHVVSGGKDIVVTLSNGQMYQAEVVGTDASTDLAVIKIDDRPGNLKPVEFADSDKLAVGENVMAVGNPLGYDDTATTGIVSALDRPVSVMDDNQQSEIVTNAVQIDAAINPGNSGGPTFNAAGQVIGINSSIASASSSSGQAGSIGIGFAIPSNLVKRVSDEIVKNGSVKHAVLGVTIKSAMVQADGVTRGGAQVTTPSNGGSAVSAGSPAAKAGIKNGDTIVAFNGKAVGSNSALLGYVRAAALGDKAKLTIVRDGKTIELDVTLDQEESKVSGSNRSENQKQNSNKNKGNSGDGSGGDDSNGSDSDGDSDGGDLGDPFGLQ